MGNVFLMRLAALYLAMFLTGCASTVTSELKPRSLQSSQPTAEVLVKGGAATVSNIYCPMASGEVETLKLESAESTMGSVGKLAFLLTPYGWATAAAHSGKKALMTLPAGRIDFEVQHVYRKPIAWQYHEGKISKITYRQWTWKQIVSANLQAGRDYVLQMPDDECVTKEGVEDVVSWLLSRCPAKLLLDDQAVASAGPSLLSLAAEKEVDINDNESDVAQAQGPGANPGQVILPDKTRTDMQKGAMNKPMGPPPSHNPPQTAPPSPPPPARPPAPSPNIPR